MINLNEAEITTIQFFKGDSDIKAYSANIILDEKFVIQLSGNEEEAHVASIPSAVECFYNNEKIQDWACENLDVDDVEAFLTEQEIENNFDFLVDHSLSEPF